MRQVSMKKEASSLFGKQSHDLIPGVTALEKMKQLAGNLYQQTPSLEKGKLYCTN